MQNNSTLSIYHFTSNIDILLSILNNGFYPHICEEDMSIVLPNYSKKIIGIPMVCFTDISLQYSEKHRKQYGLYGIGLTKKWAVEKKISPISYFVQNSAAWKLYNTIQKEVLSMLDENKIEKNKSERIIKLFIEYAGYIKPYSDNILDPVVKPFYEENEWRYTPPFANSPDSKISNWILTEDLTQQNKKALNNLMKEQYTLRFTPNDVTEIILSNENEKNYLFEKAPQYALSKIEIIPED